MSSTQNKAAFITGASYGIGQASAIALAQAGFDIIVTDLNTDSLTQTLEKVQSYGVKALALSLNITLQDSIDQALSKAFEAFPHLNTLVNNAGLPSLRKLAIDTTRLEWENIINTNLTGTFFMSTCFAKLLIQHQRPGSMIQLASTHGLVGFQGASAYGISKAGIIHLSKMLAIELAPHNIRVNSIAPGTTFTESRAPSLEDPVRKTEMLNRVPLGRFAQSEEIAGAVAYLASDLASFITGQTLTLDGGLTVY
jgi:NAD(P)-dependent dehydrogenase (short-subunit alcohol dehydrogenase family)